MVILASASPRRRELLSRLTGDFLVRPSCVNEVTSKTRPSAACRDLARQKAKDVAAHFPSDLVLGCDTVVFFRGRMLGKPKDEEQAKEYLRMLCGAWHTVYSGVCLIKGGREELGYSSSRVKLRAMSEEEISRYVSGGSPMDKAGAYGVQDGVVEKYSGECENIMGLPLNLITDMGLWKER